jgi:hypothetical protein
VGGTGDMCAAAAAAARLASGMVIMRGRGRRGAAAACDSRGWPAPAAARAKHVMHPPTPGASAPCAAALHVWKTVVTNTPKTLGELLPALMAIIIESLADPGGWRRRAEAQRSRRYLGGDV